MIKYTTLYSPQELAPGEHKPKYPTLADYFWTYCTPGPFDECWMWKGAISRRGYGVMNWRGKMYYAHRTSWEIHNGILIPNGLSICHSCDTPQCANPYHLWCGDMQENMADKINKGRQARGETQHNSKLTETEVIEIRIGAAEGAPYTDLAAKYGVTLSVISEITSGNLWKHVAGPLNFRGRTITEAEMNEMAQLFTAKKMSMRQIARQLGVSHSTVSRIIKSIAHGHTS